MILDHPLKLLNLKQMYPWKTERIPSLLVGQYNLLLSLIIVHRKNNWSDTYEACVSVHMLSLQFAENLRSTG